MRARDKGIAAGSVILATLLLMPAMGRGEFATLDEVTGQQAGQQASPPGVTAEKIKMGKELYQSEGCVTCHGADAKGKPGMTADMTDSAWKFAQAGTFEALVKVIKEGLTTAQTKAMPMPAAAARELTDAQVEALAAYTWSINQKPK